MITIVTEPDSMEKLVYFTQRTIGTGSAKAWVYRIMCPKCNKCLMGKPIDPKTGKIKIRSKEYVCPECNHTEEKKEHEESLTCEIIYTCPECGANSEASVPYKRKKYQGVDSIVFLCEKCNAKIAVTKKMKEKK